MAIGVVGGGPAGAEVAGNLRRLLRKSGYKTKVSLFAGHRFNGQFSGKCA